MYECRLMFIYPCDMYERVWQCAPTNDLAIFSYFMEKGELISSKHTTFHHFFPSSSSSTYGWINCIHIKPTTTTLKRVAEMCVLYGSNKNPEWIRYDSFLIHIILHFSCACVCIAFRYVKYVPVSGIIKPIKFWNVFSFGEE